MFLPFRWRRHLRQRHLRYRHFHPKSRPWKRDPPEPMEPPLAEVLPPFDAPPVLEEPPLFLAPPVLVAPPFPVAVAVLVELLASSDGVVADGQAAPPNSNGSTLTVKIRRRQIPDRIAIAVRPPRGPAMESTEVGKMSRPRTIIIW